MSDIVRLPGGKDETYTFTFNLNSIFLYIDYMASFEEGLRNI